MEPFRIPNSLRNLSGPYPSPDLVLDAAGRGGEPARIALARLWLSEGIPHAFLECPAVYESVRSWLSVFLSVDAKEIGIVGSARLGASIVPEKGLQPFSPDSDLDLFIVSECLFNKLKEEFCQWSLAFESGKITARNAKENKYWLDNNRRIPINISRGFIDTNRIPNLDPYPCTRRINQAMFLLPGKLKSTPNAPHPKEASLRCYRSWISFVCQNSLSLRACWEEWLRQEESSGRRTAIG